MKLLPVILLLTLTFIQSLQAEQKIPLGKPLKYTNQRIKPDQIILDALYKHSGEYNIEIDFNKLSLPAAFKATQPLLIQLCNVAKNVNCKRLTLINAKFAGILMLSPLEVSLEFVKCSFLEQIQFNGGDVQGAILFESCDIASLKITSTNFKSDLSFTGSKFHGDVKCDRMTVDRRLSFEGVKTDYTVESDSKRNENTTNIIFKFIFFRVTVKEDTSYEGFQWNGPVIIASSTFHEYALFNNMTLGVRSCLIMFDSYFDSGFSAINSNFHGPVIIKSTHFASDVSFDSSGFSGYGFNLNDVDDAFTLFRFPITLNSNAALQFLSSEVNGSLVLNHGTFKGDADFLDIHVHDDLTAYRSTFGFGYLGIKYFSDDLFKNFYPEQQKISIWYPPLLPRLTIPFKANFTNLIVDKNLDFTAAVFGGNADFSNARIGNDAIFCGINAIGINEITDFSGMSANNFNVSSFADNQSIFFGRVSWNSAIFNNSFRAVGVNFYSNPVEQNLFCVDTGGMEVTKWFADLSNSNFFGRSTFHEMQIGLDAVFSNCSFHSDALFNNTHVNRDLLLRYTTFAGKTYDGSKLTIGSGMDLFHFVSTDIDSVISLPSCEIKGDLCLDSIDLAGGISLKSTRISGSLSLGEGRFPNSPSQDGPKIRGFTDFQNLHIGDDLDISYLLSGDSWDGNMDTIEKLRFNLSHLEIGKQVSLNSSTFCTAFDMSDASIGGDFKITNSGFENNLNIEHSSIEGNLEIKDTTVIQDFVAMGLNVDGIKFTDKSSINGDLNLSGSVVKQKIELQELNTQSITKILNLTNVTAFEIYLPTNTPIGIDLGNVECNTLWIDEKSIPKNKSLFKLEGFKVKSVKAYPLLLNNKADAGNPLDFEKSELKNLEYTLSVFSHSQFHTSYYKNYEDYLRQNGFEDLAVTTAINAANRIENPLEKLEIILPPELDRNYFLLPPFPNFWSKTFWVTVKSKPKILCYYALWGLIIGTAIFWMPSFKVASDFKGIPLKLPPSRLTCIILSLTQSMFFSLWMLIPFDNPAWIEDLEIKPWGSGHKLNTACAWFLWFIQNVLQIIGWFVLTAFVALQFQK